MSVYIYLLNNGKSYSGYGIMGIVTSETPIDWAELRPRMEAWLNEKYPANTPDIELSWFLDDNKIGELFAAFGLTLAEYEEYPFDPRHTLWWDEEGYEVSRWMIPTERN